MRSNSNQLYQKKREKVDDNLEKSNMITYVKRNQ